MKAIVRTVIPQTSHGKMAKSILVRVVFGKQYKPFAEKKGPTIIITSQLVTLIEK